jgi:predicted RND superfamily exporter protein
VFSGAVPLQVVLEASESDAFKSIDSLRALHELKLWLLEQPEVGGVYTLLDYVGVLEQALAPEMIDNDPVPESSGLTSHLILLGGTEDVYRFAEPSFSSSLLQVRVRAVASSELNELTARIEDRLDKLPGNLSGYVTGSSHVIADTLDDVTRGQVFSLLAALIPIYLVLAALFKSLKLGALALIPNVLPILTFFGVLGFSGVTLNLTTSLVACVVLGIAVDDSIHFFARLRALVTKCDSAEEALEKTLIAVVRPVTFTTIGLTLGFLTLLVGELRSQVEFGLLAGFTLVVAWLLDLTFTPALAERFGVARPLRR